jgi:hypothetical protein
LELRHLPWNRYGAYVLTTAAQAHLPWNIYAAFRASSDLSLPTTTTLSKTLYTRFIYNSADSKWDLVAKLDNF